MCSCRTFGQRRGAVTDSDDVLRLFVCLSGYNPRFSLILLMLSYPLCPFVYNGSLPKRLAYIPSALIGKMNL